jgi:hypothetical protein
MNTKAIAALEALLDALKSEGSEAHAAAKPKGNRTAPHTDYAGGNLIQDLVDVARRFVRYSRTGKQASKGERKLARKVLKAVKGAHTVINTNGVDVFSHSGV